jgi:hypothetical protein
MGEHFLVFTHLIDLLFGPSSLRSLFVHEQVIFPDLSMSEHCQFGDAYGDINCENLKYFFKLRVPIGAFLGLVNHLVGRS